MESHLTSRIAPLLAAFAMVTSSGVAWSQQEAVKASIVGTWLVTGVVDQYESGKRIPNFGMAPKGQIFFDPVGRYAFILMGDTQPTLTTADPRKPDGPTVVLIGNYRINETTKAIETDVDGASHSTRLGSKQTWKPELKGDTMILVGASRKDQEGTFSAHVELKRAK
jgi:Lipocalin-like domain